MRERVLLLAMLCACKDPPKAIEEAAAPPVTTTTPPATTSAKLTTTAIVTPPPSALPIVDGGGACKLTAGPFALPYDGPAAVAIFADGPRAVFNAGGVAKVVAFAAGTQPAEKSQTPACAVAGDIVFCASPNGDIRRGDGTSIAHARPGTPIGAALLSAKPIVSFILDRKTSEGMMSMAELWSEGGTQHLSDEGNGAVWAFLTARDSDVLGVFGDARMSMSPVHARVITGGGKPTIGADAVIFVAGTAERNTRGTIAHKAGGPSFALLPIARDMSFGVAAVRIDLLPKVDTVPTWSDYANGLDPAPIAATQDGPTIYVVRVRPIDAKVNAPRILELGAMSDAGVFAPIGTIPTHGNATAVSMAREKNGALAIVYQDTSGTWAERRTCP